MRIAPESTLLAVVDIQERLLPVVPNAAGIVAAATRLAKGACLLGVRIVCTEQYPKGLGATSPDLAAVLPPPVEKVSFSCCGAAAFSAAVEEASIQSVVLVGLETHVCIQQTAIDLLAAGLTVVLAIDAVGARHAIDHETALTRLAACGAILTTTESLLFEWCRSASHPQFQAIRRLVLNWEEPARPPT